MLCGFVIIPDRSMSWPISFKNTKACLSLVIPSFPGRQSQVEIKILLFYKVSIRTLPDMHAYMHTHTHTCTYVCTNWQYTYIYILMRMTWSFSYLEKTINFGNSKCTTVLIQYFYSQALLLIIYLCYFLISNFKSWHVFWWKCLKQCVH